MAERKMFRSIAMERAFVYTAGGIMALAHTGADLSRLIAVALSFPLSWFMFAMLGSLLEDAPSSPSMTPNRP